MVFPEQGSLLAHQRAATYMAKLFPVGLNDHWRCLPTELRFDSVLFYPALIGKEIHPSQHKTLQLTLNTFKDTLTSR